MNEQEALKLLQHYRHDVSNHLQLISGYLSMERVRLAEEKLEQWVALLNEERKLMNLQAPLFALWLIRFNSLYSQSRMNYKIHMDTVNLSKLDHLLLDICQKLIDQTIARGSDTVLYEVIVELSLTDKNDIQVVLGIDGQTLTNDEVNEIINELPSEVNIEVEAEETNLKYRFMLPYGKR